MGNDAGLQRNFVQAQGLFLKAYGIQGEIEYFPFFGGAKFDQ
jgi:hypothetical protein